MPVLVSSFFNFLTLFFKTFFCVLTSPTRRAKAKTPECKQSRGGARTHQFLKYEGGGGGGGG